MIIGDIINELVVELSDKATVEFTINSKAISKERPRKGRTGHMYTPKRTQDFEKLVAEEAKKYFKHPLGEFVHVAIVIYEQRPKSVDPVDELLSKYFLHYPKRGDLDNKVKAITDGMNGIAYHDDDQIAKITAIKVYSDKDQINVSIEPIGLSAATKARAAITLRGLLKNDNRRTDSSRT